MTEVPEITACLNICSGPPLATIRCRHPDPELLLCSFRSFCSLVSFFPWILCLFTPDRQTRGFLNPPPRNPSRL